MRSDKSFTVIVSAVRFHLAHFLLRLLLFALAAAHDLVVLIAAARAHAAALGALGIVLANVLLFVGIVVGDALLLHRGREIQLAAAAHAAAVALGPGTRRRALGTRAAALRTVEPAALLACRTLLPRRAAILPLLTRRALLPRRTLLARRTAILPLLARRTRLPLRSGRTLRACRAVRCWRGFRRLCGLRRFRLFRSLGGLRRLLRFRGLGGFLRGARALFFRAAGRFLNFRNLLGGIPRHVRRGGLILLAERLFGFHFQALLFRAIQIVGNLFERVIRILRLLAGAGHGLEQHSRVRAQLLGGVLHLDFGHSLNAPLNRIAWPLPPRRG